MHKETLARRLKQVLHEKKMKQTELVEQANLIGKEYGIQFSRSNISQYVNGQFEPRQDKVYILSRALDVSPVWLMGYDVDKKPKYNEIEEVPIAKRKVPLVGSVHCGEPEYASESYDTYIDAEMECDFALRAKGDSMIGARIHQGDIVFVRKQDDVENGQIAVVIIDDDAALKRIRKLPGGYTMLMAENPKYEPIIVGGEAETRQVRILGLAVAFQGRIV